MMQVVGASQQDSGVHQDVSEADVVLGHLFVLRLRPVCRHRETEKATVDLVVQSSTDQRVQAFLQHDAEEGFVGGAVAMQQQAQHGSRREFGRRAEPAVDRVISTGDAAGDGVNQRGIGFLAGGDAGGVLAALAPDVVALLVQLRLALSVGAADLIEHGEELVGRQVGCAGDVAAVGCQEGRGRPAADVVAGVDVGAMVGVHPDGDEPFVEETGHVRVGVGPVVHLVAPVAPHCVDGQQNGPVKLLGRGESLGVPRLPGDGGISRC